MAKYRYDKAALRGLGVGAFLGEVKEREKHIAQAPAEEIRSVFNANVIAGKLHPHTQAVIVSEIREYPDAKLYTLVPDTERGTQALAYFRAGQYISIYVETGEGKGISKPYTLCSDPKDALGDGQTSYRILIKRNAKGYASEEILNEWQPGTRTVISGPLGNFYYQKLRDAGHVVAAAGGSGITPFASMAAAIVSGAEDFSLTILYGSKTEDSILLKDRLQELAENSAGRVRIVHVLSDEEREGYEHGFITAELIRKYAGEGDYSLYVCGPKAMYSFMRGEAAKLGMTARRARFEVAGEYGDPSGAEGYPAEAAGKSFRVQVLAHGETFETVCRAEETLLHACEQAGIGVTADCRSGICGWCRSRLIRGEVFTPPDADGRREADRQFGWIHPCAAYPLSDVEIEVFPSM